MLYIMNSQSTKSIEEIVKATENKGNKFFEIDLRYPQEVRKDLLLRCANFSCIKGIVINA